MAKKKTLEDYLEKIQQDQYKENNPVDYRALMTKLDGKTYRTIDEYKPKGVEKRVKSYEFNRQNRTNNIDVSNSLSPLERAYAPISYYKDKSYKNVMGTSKFSKEYDKAMAKRKNTSVNQITSKNSLLNNGLENIPNENSDIENRTVSSLTSTEADTNKKALIKVITGKTLGKDEFNQKDYDKMNKVYKMLDRLSKPLEWTSNKLDSAPQGLKDVYYGAEKSVLNKAVKPFEVLAGLQDENGKTKSDERIAENQSKVGDSKLSKGLNFIGEQGTDMLTYMALLRGTGITDKIANPIGKVTSKGLSKLGVNSTAQRLGGSFVRNALEDMTMEGASSIPDLLRGNKSIGEVAKNVATEGAIGGAFGMGIEDILSPLAKKGFSKIKKTDTKIAPNINTKANTELPNVDVDIPKIDSEVPKVDVEAPKTNIEIPKIDDLKTTYLSKRADLETVRNKVIKYASDNNISLNEAKKVFKNDLDGLTNELKEIQSNIRNIEIKPSDEIAMTTMGDDIKKKDFSVDENLDDWGTNSKDFDINEDLDNWGTSNGNSYQSLTNNRNVTVDENGIERMNNSIKFTENKPKSIIEKARTFYTRAVDINNPIKKNASKETYQKATNSSFTDGIISNILDKDLSSVEGKKINKSVKELFSDLPKGKEDDFFEYMLQKHNIDRAREGKNISFDFDSNQSAKAVAQFEKLNPEFKRKSEEITKWIDDFMQEWAVKTGLIDGKSYAELRKMYPNYIPTNRIFADDEIANSFSNVTRKYVDLSSPIKKAKGSNRDIVNPIESIINMVDNTVKTAKYNEVGLSFLNDIETGKVGDIARVVDGDVPTGKNNIVTVIKNGKKVNIEIDDEELLKSLENLNKNTDGDIAKTLRKGTNKFKSLITNYNPLFSFFNGFRDMQNYFINSVEDNPLKALARLVDSYAETFNLKKMVGVENTDLDQFKRLGGGDSNFVSRDKVPGMAKEIASGKNKKIRPLGWIEDFNNAVETAPRLAEFKNTIAKGGSLDEAMYNGADVTTNFARKGDITKSLDSGVPFLNASVQGIDKVARQFKNHPIKTTLKGLGYLTAPSLLLKNGNEDNENYQDLSNRNKDSYYNFAKEDGTFFRLPKSRDYGAIFGALPERIARSIEGDPKAFKNFGSTLTEGLSPVNPFDSNIISPFFNLQRNEDFAGRTIVPQSLQKLEPRYQYDEKTSEIGKWVGDKFNVSPKQADYLIDSYTGIIGDILLPATTGEDGLKNVYQKVLRNKFIADPVYSNQPTSDFYDNKDELEKSYNTNKFLSKNNNAIDTSQFANIDRFKGQYADLSSEISDLSKELAGETNEETIRYKKAQMISKIKQLNELYEEYKNNY